MLLITPILISYILYDYYLAKVSTFANFSTRALNKQPFLDSPVFPVNEAGKLQKGRHFVQSTCTYECVYLYSHSRPLVYFHVWVQNT